MNDLGNQNDPGRQTGAAATPVTAPSRRGRARWLAPAAAVATVAALAVGLPGPAHAVTTRPAGGHPAARPVIPALNAGLAESVKTGFASQGPVLVRSTATGKTVATVSPPKGLKFVSVAGAAANDQTYVLAAETPAQIARHLRTKDIPVTSPEAFYLLKVGATGTPCHLTRIAGVPVTATESDYALSPGGTELAVARMTAKAITVTVYNLSAGTATSWTSSTRVGGRYQPWVPGFNGWTSAGQLNVSIGATSATARPAPSGLLTVSGPGGDLLSSLARIGSSCEGLISPDGHTLVGETPGQQYWNLRECRYAGGRTTVTVPDRALYAGKDPVALNTVFWASPTGSTFLLGGVDVTKASPRGSVTGTVAGAQIKPIAQSWKLSQISGFPGQATAF